MQRTAFSFTVKTEDTVDYILVLILHSTINRRANNKLSSGFPSDLRQLVFHDSAAHFEGNQASGE
jgi:hypothetical protein